MPYRSGIRATLACSTSPTTAMWPSVSVAFGLSGHLYRPREVMRSVLDAVQTVRRKTALTSALRSLALRAVHRVHDAAGIGDPDEAELAVVSARGVEVDGADGEHALEQRLVRVDVLDAVDA